MLSTYSRSRCITSHWLFVQTPLAVVLPIVDGAAAVKGTGVVARGLAVAAAVGIPTGSDVDTDARRPVLAAGAELGGTDTGATASGAVGAGADEGMSRSWDDDREIEDAADRI